MIERVILSFEGQEILLSLNGDAYTATITAPSVSSWSQSDHVYAGTVTATDTDGSVDSMKAAIRVRENIPPSIDFTNLMDEWFFPTLMARVEFGVFDAESGVARVTVALDGEEVSVAGSNGKYVFVGEVGQGRHELTVTVTDYDGNISTATRRFAAAGLIIDRVPEDVQEIERLLNGAMRGDLASWNRLRYEDLRGAYNASDMNRVGFATECIGSVWRALGYIVPVLTAKQDWKGDFKDFDTPSMEQLAEYFADSKAIHDLIPAHFIDWQGIGVPDAPTDLTGFNYEKANTIEIILYLAATTAEFILKNTVSWASGEIASGE